MQIIFVTPRVPANTITVASGDQSTWNKIINPILLCTKLLIVWFNQLTLTITEFNKIYETKLENSWEWY